MNLWQVGNNRPITGLEISGGWIKDRTGMPSLAAIWKPVDGHMDARIALSG
jgi:hypothetical protein